MVSIYDGTDFYYHSPCKASQNKASNTQNNNSNFKTTNKNSNTKNTNMNQPATSPYKSPSKNLKSTYYQNNDDNVLQSKRLNKNLNQSIINQSVMNNTIMNLNDEVSFYMMEVNNNKLVGGANNILQSNAAVSNFLPQSWAIQESANSNMKRNPAYEALFDKKRLFNSRKKDSSLKITIDNFRSTITLDEQQTIINFY